MSKKISTAITKTTLDTNDAVVIYDSTSTDGSGVAKCLASGFRGNTILSLTSDPTITGTERIGDLALNKLTFDLFEFNGSWTLIGNIKGADGSGLSLPTWNSGATYNTNQSAVYNSILYRSKTDSNINKQPDTNPNDWEAVLSIANVNGIQPYKSTQTYIKDEMVFKYNRFLKSNDSGVTGPFDLSQWKDMDGRCWKSANKNALYVSVGDTITFTTAFASGSTMTYEGTATATLNTNRDGVNITVQGSLSNIKIFNAGGTLISQYPCQEGVGDGTAADTDNSICYDVVGSNNMTVLYKNRKNLNFTFDKTFLVTGQVSNIATVGSLIYNGYELIPDITLHNISIYRVSDGKFIRTLGVEADTTFSKTTLYYNQPRGLWIDPVLKRLYVGCFASVVVSTVPDNIETGNFDYVTHLMYNYASVSAWTTVASGAGFAGYCYGVVTDSTGQNIYCIDFSNHTIKKWTTTNGSTYAYSGVIVGNDSTTPGTYLNQPFKIRWYNNRLYIANNVLATYGILMYDLGTNTPSAVWNSWVIRDIDMIYDTTDLKQYLYFVSPAYNRVYRYDVNPSTGTLSNQALFLQTTDTDDVYNDPLDFKTKVKLPIGIAVSQSNMIVTLAGNGSVLYTRSGTPTFDSFVGGGATTTGANNTYSLGLFDNKMFVGNDSNNGVSVYDITNGYPVHRDMLGSVINLTSNVKGLSQPRGIAYSSAYNFIVVCSYSNHSIMFFRNITGYPALGKINTAHTAGTGNYQFNYPYNCWIDNSTNQLYIADMYNHRIQIYSLATIAAFLNDNTWKGSITVGYIATLGVSGTTGNTNDKFAYPQDVAVDDFYIYILDTYSNSRIQKFDKTTRAYVSSLTHTTELNHTSSHQTLNVTNEYVIVGDNTDHCIKLFNKTNFSSGTVLFLGGKGITINYQYNRGESIIAYPTFVKVYNNYLYSFSHVYRIVRWVMGGNAILETIAQNWNLSQGFKLNTNSYLIPSKAEISTPADGSGSITNPAVFGSNNCDGTITRSAVFIGYFDNLSLPTTIVPSLGNIQTGDYCFNMSDAKHYSAVVSGSNIVWNIRT